MLMLVGVSTLARGQAVTLESLLEEMADGDALARLPSPWYDSLQASSYNRESTHRDAPGWFADSDGTGFIRQEKRPDGTDEWVLMEHEGPGCITRIWTPFFYYDFADRTGPNIRIYLDGSAQPVIDEPFIPLVTAKGSIGEPFARFTARAGDLYLPIPFARSCRVVTSAKPFYYIINYRAYETGTAVETYSKDAVDRAEPTRKAIADRLGPTPAVSSEWRLNAPPRVVAAGAEWTIQLPPGPHAVREIMLSFPEAIEKPGLLRSLVLAADFDGTPCVWVPVGDYFCSADAVHPFATLKRSVTEDGEFRSRWVMPYASIGKVRFINTGDSDITIAAQVGTNGWTWDERSMHFYAGWRPDETVPGNTFLDWNFVEVTGTGVYVGDAWTVLNPQKGTWWGEGDEKIYVDGAWDAGFPTHFGTGTEDYYGWAGGEVPTRRDEFSHPFLANVRVGGLDGATLGYNIVTRERGLDAIPFRSRLRMDMECSPGVDIREPRHQLGYSSVAFWYARPGARHNRPPAPDQSARAIMKYVEIDGRGRIAK